MLADNQAGLTRLTAKGDTLYFTAGGTAPGMGKVASVSKAGGLVTDIATSQNTPFGIAVDATGVYWTSYGDGKVQARRF